MCINLYVAAGEEEELRAICKRLSIIPIVKTRTDYFITEGSVFRLHLEDSFYNKKHEPERLIEVLFRHCVDFPRSVQDQINKLYWCLKDLRYRNAYNKEAIDYAETIVKLVTGNFAFVSSHNPAIWQEWNNDINGCALGLTVFPGYALKIRKCEMQKMESVMAMQYYVSLSQPIPELEYEIPAPPRFLESWAKCEWINNLIDIIHQQVSKKYYYVCWRCSDTGVHSFFLINHPEYGLFVSNFKAPHYLPFKFGLMNLELDKEFAKIVEESPQSLEGCFRIIDFIKSRGGVDE